MAGTARAHGGRSDLTPYTTQPSRVTERRMMAKVPARPARALLPRAAETVRNFSDRRGGLRSHLTPASMRRSRRRRQRSRITHSVAIAFSSETISGGGGRFLAGHSSTRLAPFA
jgi:hypothetical protein